MWMSSLFLEYEHDDSDDEITEEQIQQWRAERKKLKERKVSSVTLIGNQTLEREPVHTTIEVHVHHVWYKLQKLQATSVTLFVFNSHHQTLITSISNVKQLCY